MRRKRNIIIAVILVCVLTVSVLSYYKKVQPMPLINSKMTADYIGIFYKTPTMRLSKELKYFDNN